MKKLRDEHGFGIPVALAVMTICLGLGLAAVAVATDTNSTTNRDASAKAALAAADAGLRVATYRLDQYQPAANNCPTVPTSAPVDSNGLCPADGPESLGNGAQFQYWVSRAMVSGDTCTGLVVDSTQNYVNQRCVTAIGTAGGVSERVQQRIAQYTSAPVFPAAIFGTRYVTIGDNATIVTNTPGQPALLGTNGVLTVGSNGGGTTTINGYSLPPGASYAPGNNVVNTGPTTGRIIPYPVPTPINPGKTAQNTASPYDTTTTVQGGTCVPPSPVPSSWVQTNCNYRLTCPPALSCDITSGPVVFDPVGRTLYLGNSASVVLGGGVYNFCSLYLSNNALITIAPLAKVSIYVDSPGDPSSGCSTATSAQGVAAGTFTMQQNSAINPGGSALAAQIYVYGDPSSSPPNNTVALTNNGSSAYALAAPFSQVQMSPSNNTTFTGAIVGNSVTIGNASHFTYQADTSSLQSGAVQLYYRSFWEQCAGPGSTSAPTAGC